MDLLSRRTERAAKLDTALPDEVLRERVLFVALAIGVWVFIVWQLWTLCSTRRTLFTQLGHAEREREEKEREQGSKVEEEVEEEGKMKEKKE